MNIEYCITSEQLEEFVNYRRMLYKGDESYVCTSEFVLTDIIYENTDFAKECTVLPAVVRKEGVIVAECVYIHNVKLPYLSVGFFEADKNQNEAVQLILKEARAVAKRCGVKKIVIGHNGHLSYGVGILTNRFDYKNSFDSNYNKQYYAPYFSGLKKQSLSTYKQNKKLMEEYLIDGKAYKIRKANMKNFYQEAELMRELCDKTIGKTFLYFPTEKAHFYQLMRDLRPFLMDENLLFAEDKAGNTVGFLFWHPDFNQMLKGGKHYSTLGIALAYIFKSRKIKNAKLNAIGAFSPRVTSELLNELSRVMGNRFETLETNFVWDNNLPSTLVNKRFFGEPHRKYEVYFDEID